MAKIQLVEIHPKGTREILMNLIEYVFELSKGEGSSYLYDRSMFLVLEQLKIHEPLLIPTHDLIEWEIIKQKCANSEGVGGWTAPKL